MRISDWSSDVCSSDLSLERGFRLVADGGIFGRNLGAREALICGKGSPAGARKARQPLAGMQVNAHGRIIFDKTDQCQPFVGGAAPNRSGQRIPIGKVLKADRQSTRLKSSH